MNTIKIDAKQCKMVAHRGVSGLEKENTNLAFVAAGNRSYFGIETDIHRTSDGKFIVIHDTNTDRVAGFHCNVEQTDLTLLRRITLLDPDGNAGHPDLHLPTLQEYAETCKKYEKVSVLELKGAMSAEDVAGVIEVLRAADQLENTIFISFGLQNLIYVREQLPEQPIQLLLKAVTPADFETLLKYRFDLDVDYQNLTEELVAELHAKKILVNCWTVNDPADAERLIAWGVDFITSNILEGA